MTAPVISLTAITTALALRFETAQLGTPTGQVAMKKSLSKSPKSVPQAPFHFLEVQDGELVANPGQWKHEFHIDGVFVLAKRQGDPERVDAARQAWLPYLLHATVDQLKLGLGGASGYSVDKALPVGWEFTEEQIGGDPHDGIRVHWTVYVTENVSLTA